MPLPAFLDTFAAVPDPRVDRTKLHSLLDILVISLCAVLCGAEGWEDIEEFGRAKETWLRERLGLALPNGIPSHDTFRRVLARIHPDAFRRAFLAWTGQLRVKSHGEVIALDGKTLRHSFDTLTGQAPLHMVTAWATDNRLVLAQLPVNQKSNEIPAFPALLSLLDVRDCVVTIDAMGCQKEIARQIIDQGGDYLLALKANQPTMEEGVRLFFEDGREHGFGSHPVRGSRSVEKDHGRIETREYWMTEAIDWLDGKEAWAGVRSIGRVERKRRVGEAESVEVSYFISSLAGSVGRFAGAVRGHWGIENQEHYILDVTFEEDGSRIRRENAPENLAVLRHIALNLLQREVTLKRGVKGRMKRAGWDEEYLLRVLAGGERREERA
jgi:predicted transposase YbfD/YdcC